MDADTAIPACATTLTAAPPAARSTRACARSSPASAGRPGSGTRLQVQWRDAASAVRGCRRPRDPAREVQAVVAPARGIHSFQSPSGTYSISLVTAPSIPRGPNQGGEQPATGRAEERLIGRDCRARDQFPVGGPPLEPDRPGAEAQPKAGARGDARRRSSELGGDLGRVRPRKCRPPIVKLASETMWSEVRGGGVAAAAVGSTTRNAAATATAISIVLIASQRSDGS